MTFDGFFKNATGPEQEPYPFQRKFAEAKDLYQLVDVPTGLGKTAMAVLGWLWRRHHPDKTVRETTPRRLVYCLPMRVLAEQTRDNAVLWLHNLGLLGGEVLFEQRDDQQKPKSYTPNFSDPAKVTIHLLMGGEEQSDWAMWPEREMILIGTQDMLLSRALNRGYAASRARWPMEFGLLHNDCLWIFDEIQLMGSGLATGLQLEAFRSDELNGKSYFGTERQCTSCYMSATAGRRLLISREWRKGDGDKRRSDFILRLSPAEKNDRQGVLGQRRLATKQLDCQLSWSIENSEAANRIMSLHRKMLGKLDGAPQEIPRRTLVICNTVNRARAIHTALSDLLGEGAENILVLLHSRFRPTDRARQQDRLKIAPDVVAGQIVVATQVVEAGVDLSSATLWTEIAPLPSIIQRLGRLNRAAEFGHDGQFKYDWTPLAVVLGVPLPPPPTKQSKEEKGKHEKAVTHAYLPYDRGECQSAQESLKRVRDASPANLETKLRTTLDSVLQPPAYSLQRHELLDFFDTDSNLSLGYTDVSPFVRGIDPETDIYVAWREWEGDVPPYDFDIGRHEICQVPIWQVVGKDGLSTWHRGFVWLGRERGWQQATRDNLLPGATLLLPTGAGGYDNALGWTGKMPKNNLRISDLYQPSIRPTDEDLLSSLERGWQSIESHTIDVQSCWNSIRQTLALDDDKLCATIDEAILWHDYGKAIEKWQEATHHVADEARLVWPAQIAPVGKFAIRESPLLESLTGPELQHELLRLKHAFRPELRHEVASALALRQHHRRDGCDPTIYELLTEYLVMAHHGHVRKTLRDELPRDPQHIRRGPDKIRGIREGMTVPGFSINDNTLPTTTALSISCRQMGRSPDGQEGWTRSVLRLLDHFGPFRLAYYEALVRAADRRASAEPKTNVVIASPGNFDSKPVTATVIGETK